MKFNRLYIIVVLLSSLVVGSFMFGYLIGLTSNVVNEMNIVVCEDEVIITKTENIDYCKEYEKAIKISMSYSEKIYTFRNLTIDEKTLKESCSNIK